MFSVSSSSRILVVAPQPFYEDRGTPIAVRQLLDALSERGCTVDLLTFPVGQDIALPGLQIHRAGRSLGIRSVPIGLSIRKLLLDLTLIPRLVRLIGERRYHHIHAVEESVFPVLLLARLFRVPVIYDMQSSLPAQLARGRPSRWPPLTAALRACERWAVRGADAIVCSAGLRKHVESIAPETVVQEWFFTSAPSQPDPDEVARVRERLDIPASARVVLYAGNFATYQGLDLLLDAAPRVVERVPGTVFVLVGAHAPDSEQLPATAIPLLGSGALRVVARQHRDDLPTYLALADVLVCPRSFGDNLSLKVFDYLAAGRAIVATDTEHHRRVLDDGRAVLAGRSREEFGDAIAALLLDPDRAARLGVAAGVYAAEHLEWTKFSYRVAEMVRRFDSDDRAA